MPYSYALTATTKQNGAVAVTCVDCSKDVRPTKIANYKCNCKYPWLRELHGLNALMMSESLSGKLLWLTVILVCAAVSIANASYILGNYSTHQTSTLITIRPVKKLVFPTLVFCPKYADELNYTAVLKDIFDHVGNLSGNNSLDLIQYMIAGTGFDNVNLKQFEPEYLEQLGVWYEEWRGDRSVLELFRLVFDQNGVTCEQVFHSCYAGSQTLDCCKIFSPTYVMTRGRCFRLISPYYQTDVDETDKLSLFFNKPDNPLLGTQTTRSQVVVYLGDENPEVSIFPRYYLNTHDFNRARMVQKKISMLPALNKMCSSDSYNKGKSTCFVHTWLTRDVVGVLNCSLAYFHDMLPYMRDVPVCHPRVVVDNYNNIMTNRVEDKCLPACDRVVNEFRMFSTIDLSPSTKYQFRIEVSFSNLEYEQYDEIRTTSLAGFISELGGQSGLFIGCSVITLVQLVQSIILTIYERSRRFYRRYLSLIFSVERRKEVTWNADGIPEMTGEPE